MNKEEIAEMINKIRTEAIKNIAELESLKKEEEEYKDVADLNAIDSLLELEQNNLERIREIDIMIKKTKLILKKLRRSEEINEELN